MQSSGLNPLVDQTNPHAEYEGGIFGLQGFDGFAALGARHFSYAARLDNPAFVGLDGDFQPFGFQVSPNRFASHFCNSLYSLSDFDLRVAFL